MFSYPEEEHVNEGQPLSSGRKMSVLASSLRNTDPFSKAPLILSDQEVFHHEAIKLRFPICHYPLPALSLHVVFLHTVQYKEVLNGLGSRVLLILLSLQRGTWLGFSTCWSIENRNKMISAV